MFGRAVLRRCFNRCYDLDALGRLLHTIDRESIGGEWSKCAVNCRDILCALSSRLGWDKWGGDECANNVNWRGVNRKGQRCVLTA